MSYEIQIKQRNEKTWSTVQITGNRSIAMDALQDYGKYLLATLDDCDFKARLVDKTGKVLCERHLKHTFKNFT